MLLNRRRAMRSLAGIGAACFIPAWNETVEAADTLTCVPTTPTVTEGPYWVDEKLFRSDIRTDPTTGVARAGVPLTLTINMENLATSGCSSLAGAYVDIWHCDAKGIYSDESTYNPGGGTGTVNTAGQRFLRGYQITDESGKVTFTTVYPGWYSGRTIHIHVRVRTYSGKAVLSNFVTQVFFDDAVNNTVLAQSAYSRTGNRDTTNVNDMVYSVANKERMLATVAGDVTNGYAAAITIGTSFQTPAAAKPSIASGGITNASSGAAGVAPNTWISLYGSNLTTTPKTVGSSDLVNGALPTTLGDVSVQVNGKVAYLQYVSASQVNLLTPSDASAGPVAITVTNSAGTSATSTAMMQQVLPGLSVASNYVRAAAIAPGEILELYGTGFGATDPTPADGLVFTGAYRSTKTISVTVGGVSADVLWAGLVGPGLYQIDVRVPSSIANGDQAVIATVDGISSQSTAKVKVATGNPA